MMTQFILPVGTVRAEAEDGGDQQLTETLRENLVLFGQCFGVFIDPIGRRMVNILYDRSLIECLTHLPRFSYASSSSSSFLSQMFFAVVVDTLLTAMPM